MAEAQQGFATLGEVDQGTFSRFVEWLYRGCYHAAEPKQLEVAVAAKEPEEPKKDTDVLERCDAWENPVSYDDGDLDRPMYASKKLVKREDKRN